MTKPERQERLEPKESGGKANLDAGHYWKDMPHSKSAPKGGLPADGHFDFDKHPSPYPTNGVGRDGSGQIAQRMAAADSPKPAADALKPAADRSEAPPPLKPNEVKDYARDLKDVVNNWFDGKHQNEDTIKLGNAQMTRMYQSVGVPGLKQVFKEMQDGGMTNLSVTSRDSRSVTAQFRGSFGSITLDANPRGATTTFNDSGRVTQTHIEPGDDKTRRR